MSSVRRPRHPAVRTRDVVVPLAVVVLLLGVGGCMGAFGPDGPAAGVVGTTLAPPSHDPAPGSLDLAPEGRSDLLPCSGTLDCLPETPD